MLLIYGWKYAGKSSSVSIKHESYKLCKLLYSTFCHDQFPVGEKSKSSFFGFYYSWNRNNCCWDSFSCLLTDDGNFVVRQLWTPFNIWLHKFSSLRCLRKSAYCALLIISYLDIREKRPKMAKKNLQYPTTNSTTIEFRSQQNRNKDFTFSYYYSLCDKREVNLITKRRQHRNIEQNF